MKLKTIGICAALIFGSTLGGGALGKTPPSVVNRCPGPAPGAGPAQDQDYIACLIEWNLALEKRVKELETALGKETAPGKETALEKRLKDLETRVDDLNSHAIRMGNNIRIIPQADNSRCLKLNRPLSQDSVIAGDDCYVPDSVYIHPEYIWQLWISTPPPSDLPRRSSQVP
jgi:hypothetical protein